MKIEERYHSTDLRAAWKGIKQKASVNRHRCKTRQLIHVNDVDDVHLPNAFTVILLSDILSDVRG